jgi:basic membrane protein A
MLSRRTWLGSVLALTACSGEARPHTGTTLGMVTDLGGLGDHSYNDAAWAGMVEAHDRLGARIAVLQSRSSANYQPSMMVFAAHGYDQVFCIGYDVAHDLTEVAERFPGIHFAIIDAVVDEPNVTSVTFKSNEASFLAGALAAMVSRTRTIGFLGGIDIPIIWGFEVGFAAGARQIDPRVGVLVKYVGDFADVPAGAELTSLLFGADADIVFAAAGKAGLGMVRQLRQRRGVYGIGVDIDQDDLVPGRILTSVLKRIDVSVFRIAELAVARRPRPRVAALGLKEDGVGLTDFTYTRDVVTAEMIAELDRLRRSIVAGTIVVPVNRDELAAFRPVPMDRLR